MKKAKSEMRSEYKRSDFTKLERGKFHAEGKRNRRNTAWWKTPKREFELEPVVAR